jgi:hypothetical protein
MAKFTNPPLRDDPCLPTQNLWGFRARTIAAISDVDDDRLLGPKLEIVNPPLWEVGQVAWFQEKWVLRHACGLAPSALAVRCRYFVRSEEERKRTRPRKDPRDLRVLAPPEALATSCSTASTFS